MHSDHTRGIKLCSIQWQDVCRNVLMFTNVHPLSHGFQCSLFIIQFMWWHKIIAVLYPSPKTKATCFQPTKGLASVGVLFSWHIVLSNDVALGDRLLTGFRLCCLISSYLKFETKSWCLRCLGTKGCHWHSLFFSRWNWKNWQQVSVPSQSEVFEHLWFSPCKTLPCQCNILSQKSEL